MKWDLLNTKGAPYLLKIMQHYHSLKFWVNINCENKYGEAKHDNMRPRNVLKDEAVGNLVMWCLALLLDSL